MMVLRGGQLSQCFFYSQASSEKRLQLLNNVKDVSALIY